MVTLAGAVLTGGSSTRMGSEKATFVVDEIPMAARVVAAMRSVGCSPIVLVGGDPTTVGRLGERLVPDLVPGSGPAGGVVSAITALGTIDTGAELIVIASCDLPYLTDVHLRSLIESIEGADANGDGFDVAVARSERLQPLCGVWRASTLTVIADAFASGVRSVLGLLDLLRVIEVPIEADGLRNVNTPADLGGPPPHH